MTIATTTLALLLAMTMPAAPTYTPAVAAGRATGRLSDAREDLREYTWDRRAERLEALLRDAVGRRA